MTANELRQKFLDFMKSKGHTIIPSASLIPENDPTTLFTGSGMQPMLPYLMGEKHPEGAKIADSQKCFRTVDIEEVGDNRHTTFFEMLGNWSLGDYFKKEQIDWIFEFLIKELGLNPNNFYVSVFRGKEDIKIPRDDEAVKLWQEKFKEVGIDAKAVDLAEKNGMQGGKIFYYDETKNWWSRSGVTANMPIGEPGGPSSEMFWDFGEHLKIHENSPWKNEPCHINCDCGRFLEIGNNVFMTYVKTANGFEPLKQKNVDYGGGLERQIAAVQNDPDVFNVYIFKEAIKTIEKLSNKKYEDEKESFRVILDHLRAATFLIGDNVLPSNKDQGYFVRRIIRRAVRFAHKLGIERNFCGEIAKIYINDYKNQYANLESDQQKILEELEKEESNFRKTLELGLKYFEVTVFARKPKEDGSFWTYSEIEEGQRKKILVSIYENAFNLFQTYGFPFEMIIEEAKRRNIPIDENNLKIKFKEQLTKHQKESRTASAGKFKGGLADASVETTKLHTAAHLLLESLRRVLSEGIFQKGSNITAERLRFDFNYPQKMTEEQIKKVEDLVNQKIQEKLEVEMTEMPKEEALKIAKISFDPAKYGDVVKVYKIGDPAKGGQVFSVELCGGPHVKNTSELGHFKITKEESSSAGVRRIKAILE